MDLSCTLSPLVFAELYRILTDERFDLLLGDRLAELDLDFSWLNEASAAYDECWRNDVGGADDAAPPRTLSEDHALLATWLLATLRNEGPSADFGHELRTAVAARAVSERPDLATIPNSLAPTVIGWTLGTVVGEFDFGLPVFPARLPGDPDVALAYRGFVEHVDHLATVNEPWPEMLGNSTLWRAAGLAEGLRPAANGPAASIDQLMAEIRSLTPELQYEQLRRHWIDFIDLRNVLTHVKPGPVTFRDSVDAACTSDRVRPTVMGVTYFVCQEVSRELSGIAGRVVHPGLWDEQLRYEIGYF